MAQQVNDSNFEEVVLKSNKPVVVDFWAEWCGPCRAIGPIIEDLAREYEGKVVVAKLNVDENTVTSTNYDIRSIPTLLFFKDGKVVDKLIGAVPKNNIKAKIDALLQNEIKN